MALKTRIFLDARLSKSGDAGLAGAKTKTTIRQGIAVVKNIIIIYSPIRMALTESGWDRY